MRKLHFLKTLLDLFWFFLICALIGLTITVPIMVFSSEPFDLPVKINGQTLTIVDLPSKIMMCILLVSSWSFGYGVYLLRQLLSNFSKRKIFEATSIALLNKIGKCFLITSLLTSIPAFFYKVFVKNSLEVDFGGGFESFLFTASLGLFFMVLSEVFTVGKSIKEENELTV